MGGTQRAVWLLLWIWLGALSRADLVVATYNVENYNQAGRMTAIGYQKSFPKAEEAKARLRAVIVRLDADVLVMEEMGDEAHLRELQRDLAREGCWYPHLLWAAGQDPDRHLAMLARRTPLAWTAHNAVPYPGRNYKGLVRRGVLEATFALGPERVTLFAFHLKSRGGRNKADPESAGERAREAEAVRDLVLRRTAETGPLYLLLGDANDTQRSRPLAALTAKGKRTISRLVPAEDGRGEVWTHAYAREGVYSRIDYILASPALWPRISGGRGELPEPAEARGASDHRPVRVRLLEAPTSDLGLDRGAVEISPAGEDAAEDVVGGEPVGGAEDVDAGAVLDEAVGPADPLDGRGALGVLQRLQHGGAEPAGEDVILHGDEQGNDGRLAQQKFAVERLGEAGVDHAHREALFGLEAVGEVKGFLHHGPQGPDDDVRALAQHFGLADGQRGRLSLDLDAHAGTAGITNERGTRVAHARVQHVDQLILVLGLHDHRVGDDAQIGDVEESVMGGTVVG